MNAVAKIQVMDWSVFTVEEWLKQYGAYIQTCRMKSGNAPDDLGVSQIYWLICENNKGVVLRKDQLICMIDDFEAEEVRKMIFEMRNSRLICTSAKMAVLLFIEKSVRGMSLRQMANEFCLGKTSIDNMVFAGKFYMNGHDKRLRLE
ncbi:hypothetical protein [Acinetobacter kyonggiensis]|uniref:Phage antitermination protein Q n=1 Tax=Acinetobacter kyonggiensis TaxID=595670 RepID=A0A1H3L8J8_9GAMM|nr:hypothetical protein [Acinetobacter kyonggiensis]SDY60254.1 hypothetical protein SAMN05421643_11639 [Acinetobacter kyonggiensis]